MDPTPFEAMYGRTPPIISHFLPRETEVEVVHQE
jgi:hypothetical protein